MAKELRWELKDIIEDQTFEQRYEKIEKSLQKFSKIRKELSPNIGGKKFKEIIEFTEDLKEQLGRIDAYTSLILAGNLKSKKARVYQSKLDNLSLKITNESLFLTHWIKGLEVKGLKKLDDKNAKRLFKTIPDMKFVLEHAREAAKHTLTEKEEKLIHVKDMNGVSVVTELYDLITNDFKFNLKMPDSTTKIIDNQQKLVSLVHCADPKIRKAAYQALFVPYKENVEKFFLIYSAIAKDWKLESKFRNYPSSISMRNFANQIPDTTITLLLEVCTNNIKIFQKYFKIKAKLLGMKKLKRYDVYAPLFEDKEKFSFDDGKKIVFETFEEFWPEFAKKARQIIDNKHLDSHPRENKRNGAFCMSIAPSILPYVMTNYDYRKRDVSTLAHELGHAIHDIYGSDHYPSSMHAGLPLCETASTFCEMVVFEKILSLARNNEEKKALLIDKLADSYATIIRQNYFIKFEILAHEKLEQGCTDEELSDLYLSLLKEQFGSSVDVSDEFRYEWSYIPHIFHSPFYCYAYNFGELLSLALYARYKKEGKNFIPKIEKVLEAGGSVDPTKLLASIDVDINSKEFWQGGFAIIESWVKELEKLD